MKKRIALLTVLALIFSTGCSQHSNQENNELSSQSSVLDTEPEAEKEEHEETEFSLENQADSSSIVCSGTCGYDATWMVTENGILTISGTGKTIDCFIHNSWNMAPWDLCFDEELGDLARFHTVIIEEGITELGAGSFYGYNLEEIVLPESLKIIGDNAIEVSPGCPKPLLQKINIPSGLEYVGRGNFNEGVYEIDNYEEWMAMVADAEEDRDRINYTIRYDRPFIKQMPDGTIEQDNLLVCENSVVGIQNSEEVVSIPDGIVSIDDYAFFDEKITDLYIPDSVVKIGEFAYGFTDAGISGFSVAPLGNVTIHGSAGSAADRYAQKYSIHFVEEQASEQIHKS